MARSDRKPSFRHEALLYAGDDEFVERVSAFVQSGLADDESAMVLATASKIGLLRPALAGLGSDVAYVDAEKLGRNPARISPCWRDFIDAHPGRPVRGVGEPLFAGRSAAERAEVHIHESLLNIAFPDAAMWMLCPYDIKALSIDDIETAIDNHPLIDEQGQRRDNEAFAAIDWFGGALPEPEAPVVSERFDLYSLHDLRKNVERGTREFGLDQQRRDEFVLAMSEIATNSLLYGGGEGRFRCWIENDRYVCEVSDRGRIGKPLAGRIRAPAGQAGGHGLYLVNQLADLVQVRSNDDGTVVRIHITHPGADGP
jgi:anti-sigma regulatory factor (Ser/Thr protein kinase)